MPTMSRFEAAFCRSAPWRFVARRIVLPWALQGAHPVGDVLEIGAGSGAMAAELLATHPDIRMTVTDFDAEMVTAAEQRLAPFADRTTTRQADGTDLPFAWASALAGSGSSSGSRSTTATSSSTPEIGRCSTTQSSSRRRQTSAGRAISRACGQLATRTKTSCTSSR